MKFFTALIVCTLAVSALAGDFECPNQKNRKYAHEEFCDTYWDCREGEAIESVCPDGLVFDSTRRKNLDPCDNPYNVDCEDLVKFSHEPQQVHEKCPRLNGIFGHPDPAVCHLFYQCIDGVPTEQVCQGGLVWSPKTGSCSWAADSGRDTTICKREEKTSSGFQCPPGGSIGVHTRHEDPESCESFYLCLNGVDARIQGCDRESGFVYNDATKQCGPASDLPKDHDCYQANE